MLSSAARRDSYAAWDKSRDGTRLAPFTGSWVTADTPLQGQNGGGSASRLGGSGATTPAATVTRGSGARRLSYYGGFISDVLTPEDRAASATAVMTSGAGGGGRAPATVPVPSRPQAGSVSRGGEELVESSLSMSHASRLSTTTTTPRDSLTRRRTSASVVDPLNSKGADFSESRPRRSVFDAQLAAAMVNTAHRMSVAESATGSRGRRASQLSNSPASSTRARVTSGTGTSSSGVLSRSQSGALAGAPSLPALHSPLGGVGSDVASYHTAGRERSRMVEASALTTTEGSASATRRITFSPFEDGPHKNQNGTGPLVKGGAGAAETVGWGLAPSSAAPSSSTQRPSSGSLSSGSGREARHQRTPSSQVAPPSRTSRRGTSVTGLPADAPTRWGGPAPAPPENAPQLSHKQLTEAFYGRYKGGVMAKDAYLYFLASQAEEKHKQRRAKQRKAEHAVDARAPSRRTTEARPSSSSAPWVGEEEEEATELMRDPSAAFDAIGMPPPGTNAALQARLRSMSLQSNLPFSPTWPVTGAAVRVSTPATAAAVTATALSPEESSPREMDSSDGAGDFSCRRQGSGYYQFLCIQDPPSTAEHSGTSSAGSHSVRLSGRTTNAPGAGSQRSNGGLPQQVNSTPSLGSGAGAMPSTHLQELLRKSQALYGAKHVTA